MAIISFPNVELADENGLLAFGGDLEISSLLLAYKNGIFPWPYSEFDPIAWYSPNPRGILDFQDLHISSSLKKLIKKSPYTVKFNSDFEHVILACASSSNRKEKSTWITRKMIEAYIDFHYAGNAYSVEVYDQSQELVGGLYGVKIKKFISGESMFYTKPNASKIALLALIEKCISENITWMDTQMVTPVIKSFGGKDITRDEFLKKLEIALK